MRVRGPSGDHVVFSVTLSEGFMDEYVTFALPVVTDPLSDDEFDSVAVDSDLGLYFFFSFFSVCISFHSLWMST